MAGDAGEVIVEGDVERVTFESETSSFRVLKVAVQGKSERLAVVGSFPPVGVGAHVRVRGRFIVDKKHGPQFEAASVTEVAPSTLEGVQRYLGSGAIKGVGETYAARIVAAFGLDTLRVLDEEPHRLASIPGFGGKRVQAITSGWQEQRAVREVMIFLQAHGASPALAARLYKRYGASTVSVVAREPYRLSIDVWGVGFKTADRIAAGLGVARDSPQRLQAGLLQCVRDARDAGHVYLPQAELVGRARELLAIGGAEEAEGAALAHALLALQMGGYVVVEGPSHARIVFPADLHAAEERLCRGLVRLMNGDHPRLATADGVQAALARFEKETGVSLAGAQREAVLRASESPLLVITGGPGVGKTTIVRAVLALFDRAGLAVRLAAPTGRAAKRMSEATGKDASTLHRLLEFDPKTARWKRDHERPVEAGALVVDEASMIDLPMAEALVAATGSGTRLVLVGDVDQLASVGPGAVLRDVIASGVVPCVRLTEIFRQARESRIVVNAHRIRAGEEPLAPPEGDPQADFFLIDRKDPEAARRTIVDLVVSHIPRRFGLDPVRDVQVLTPMHRGPCGALALNEALQLALNPELAPGAAGARPAVTHRARTFRVGDKVMQLRNDYERNVWNGDLGFVVGAEPEEDALTVTFDAGTRSERTVPYDRAALDELTLAYACTVHKSQGSEYPAVVVPLLTTHFVMLSRQLLYTAVTRGKRLVVLVADPRALSLAVAEERRDERRTTLAGRLVSAYGAAPASGRSVHV